MEASKFGFGISTPPAFKFDPTDDDIVAHYLLPRALGIQDPPFGAAVHEADTASLRLPPLELLALHDHTDSHQAFFFDVTGNGGRRERVVKGGDGDVGMWRGQKPYYHTLTLLRPGGGEVDITYKRYHLTYKILDEEEEEKEEKSKKRKKKLGVGAAPSGWVMHEYQIISPPLQNTVLSRIKLANGKIKEDRQQRADVKTEQAVDFDQHHQDFPALEQPCPSYYQDFPNQEPSCQQDFPYQEQAGPSYYQDICSGGEGFSDGSQVDDASCYSDNGGGIGDGFLNMLCAGEDFGCGGGVGLSQGNQADDASCYSDNGGAMGDGFMNMLCAGEAFAGDNTYMCGNGGGGEGFSDGCQAADASCYGTNGGGMGDGFVNMLCAGEGFAGDNTYMCVGGGQGFSDGSQVADASCYGGNGGGTGDSFANMLYAGEGFASDSTYNGNKRQRHGV